MNVMFVEPEFPIPTKSKNHKNFLPISLLKLASYYREKGNEIKLVRGNLELEDNNFIPDEIKITSLFTYWAPYVKDCVSHYKKLYPNARITVGGIYASLMPEHCKDYTKCDDVFVGVHKKAENYEPAYDLIPDQNPHFVDYQIIHTSRGCPRECKFCGTWKIEPEFISKNSIITEIKSRNIVFYDNNLLKNEYIEDILKELIELKKKRKILWCESQSGFDGRILLNKPYLAKMLKLAGFRNPRIAWDWRFNDNNIIKKQLDILVDSGYRYSHIFIFMIYNWDIPFREMERKRIKCWEWRVQISDCRYRPLNQTFDNYKPLKKQTNNDYFIHEKWSDKLIKQFRKNVRRQNICIRQNVEFYSREFERKKIKKEIFDSTKKMSRQNVEDYLIELNIDYWYPGNVTYPAHNSNNIKEKKFILELKLTC